MKINILKILLFSTVCLLLGSTIANADYDPSDFVGLETLLDHGDPADKIDMVFMPCGYTLDELDTFANVVNDMVNELSNESPFDDFLTHFNIHRVDVVSEESGASHPTDDPPVYVNNVFDCTYGAVSAERVITGDAEAIYLAAQNAPDADQIVIVVNDPEYGGSGGSIAFVAASFNYVRTFLHELGHSFAFLADEYFSGETTFTGSEPSQPNVTTNPGDDLEADPIKWAAWFDQEAIELGELLLPTPWTHDTDDPNLGIVGLFEGAQYFTYGKFRPTITSTMRNSSEPFKEVNSEAIVLSIFDYIDFGFEASPDEGPQVILEGQELTYEASSTMTGTMVEWHLNDELISTEPQSSTLTLDYTNFVEGVNEVKGIVKYPSEYVRNDPEEIMSKTSIWTVFKSGTGQQMVVSVPETLEVNALDKVSFNVIGYSLNDLEFDMQLLDRNGQPLSSNYSATLLNNGNNTAYFEWEPSESYFFFNYFIEQNPFDNEDTVYVKITATDSNNNIIVEQTQLNITYSAEFFKPHSDLTLITRSNTNVELRAPGVKHYLITITSNNKNMLMLQKACHREDNDCAQVEISPDQFGYITLDGSDYTFAASIDYYNGDHIEIEKTLPSDTLDGPIITSGSDLGSPTTIFYWEPNANVDEIDFALFNENGETIYSEHLEGQHYSTSEAVVTPLNGQNLFATLNVLYLNGKSKQTHKTFQTLGSTTMFITSPPAGETITHSLVTMEWTPYEDSEIPTLYYNIALYVNGGFIGFYPTSETNVTFEVPIDSDNVISGYIYALEYGLVLTEREFEYNTEIAFIRGDANSDGKVTITDAPFISHYLFTPGADIPPCLDAADANDDGIVNLADVTFLNSALFDPDGPTIPAPTESPTLDPTPDSLDCFGLADIPTP